MNPESPYEIPQRSLPQATLEMSLLHTCRYKLPDGKARALLGYEPLITFPEASRRTIAWLAFAGYPVRS
jgi:2-alkyl-3-oxoalkanoate reductase